MKTHVGQRILVPIDGSDFSRLALGPSADVAAGSEGELFLLLVITENFERMVETFMTIEHVTPEAAAAAHLHRIEQDVCGELDDLNVSQVIRTSTDPAGEIIRVATDIDATMIALTSHGYTGFKKLLLGSVAESVLHNSPVPVLLVPSDDRP